jgi:very-short-patch-repair endonuclease
LGFEVLRFKNQELEALERVLAAIEKRAKERIAEGLRKVEGG